VGLIDQTALPHRFVTRRLVSLEEAAHAIRSMQVRGAPLIGAAAAYGIALQMHRDPSDSALEAGIRQLGETRPTAVNLSWALEEMRVALEGEPEDEREKRAYQRAAAICDEDVATCEAIGDHGLSLLREAWLRRGRRGRLNVLTHCNAGWLATVDWGTALAPVYKAQAAGLPVHVWVDETRPRNQGSSLTAWELVQQEVPHTVVADSAGGHLIQHGHVDLCLTGTDRTTATGDVCNKIGTYLKALACTDNDVPFYVAVPRSSIDWSIRDGLAEIEIEERDPREVTHVAGRDGEGRVVEVALTPVESPARNFGFDVTPARLVTALVTERGVCPASEEGLARLYGRHSAGG